MKNVAKRRLYAKASIYCDFLCCVSTESLDELQ